MRLSTAIAFTACQKGPLPRFLAITGLVTQLLERREQKELERFHRQLERLDLLVLNELGYVPCSKAGAELLFEVVRCTCKRTSLIVTTNLTFESWTEIMAANNSPACCATGSPTAYTFSRPTARASSASISKLTNHPDQLRPGRRNDHRGSTITAGTGVAVFDRHPLHFSIGVYTQACPRGAGAVDHGGLGVEAKKDRIMTRTRGARVCTVRRRVREFCSAPMSLGSSSLGRGITVPCTAQNRG